MHQQVRIVRSILIVVPIVAAPHCAKADELNVARVLKERLGAMEDEMMRLPLDGSVEGRAGDRKITARLGPLAEFVESVEGQGVEPGATGPAVVVSVPDALWKPQGTLMFRMRPSRMLRGGEEGLQINLLECPIFELTLDQTETHIRLRADLKHDGTMSHTQTLDRFALGKVEWSHLKANKWYHVAITWDSNFPENRLELFLNGALQQEMRPGRAWWYPWNLPDGLSGDLTIGGSGGEGARQVRVAVDSIGLYPVFMNAAEVGVVLQDQPNFALTNEGRWDHDGELDLNGYRLTPIYETEFEKPLNWIVEDELFEGDRRTRRPEGKDWVLEGGGKAWTQGGRLVVLNNGQHQVLWSTQEFPADFLLEFGMSPRDPRSGLGIVFFAARSLDGGSPFELDLPRRAGKFGEYIRGELQCYHCSYWATVRGILRRTANLRKNPGFAMPAVGIDRIGGTGPGPHRVRLLKVGGRIQLETEGRLALVFEDDGNTHGPKFGDGYIGLRQMAHSRRVSYTHFKVWKVEPRR